MLEWLEHQYLKLITNYEILLKNPTGCSAVDLLQLFTLTLGGVFLIRLLLHLFLFYRMRRASPEYSEDNHPQLMQIYRSAGKKVGIRRLPPLYMFRKPGPTVFTIGSLRPSVFLAPQIAEELPADELEAALVHELTHIKRWDTFLIWILELFFLSIPALIIQVFAISFVFSVEKSVYAILGALATLLFFKGFLYRKILYLRELSCDDLTVDAIRDPLLLASSIISIWRLGRKIPEQRLLPGFNFAQTFLPVDSIRRRVERLLDYKRPRFKFLFGRLARIAILTLILMTTALILWGGPDADGLSGDDRGLHRYCIHIEVRR
ncbi:M48 family metalloprotease [bacterium]|nr:M48 family metalloprotease [bacterium]